MGHGVRRNSCVVVASIETSMKSPTQSVWEFVLETKWTERELLKR